MLLGAWLYYPKYYNVEIAEALVCVYDLASLLNILFHLEIS